MAEEEEDIDRRNRITSVLAGTMWISYRKLKKYTVTQNVIIIHEQ
jgi:hypothetical protein